MPSTSGSLELCARELASAFVPLRDLAPATAPALFLDLGIPLPAATLAQAGFQNALAVTANAAGALPEVIDRLTTAFSGSTTDAITIGAELIAKLGITVGSLSAIESALPPGSGFVNKLSGYLLIRWFEFAVPALSNGLTLLGLFDRVHDPGVAGDPDHPPRVIRTLRFERLGMLLTKPEQLVDDVYGWGSQSFDGATLLTRLSDILVDIPYPFTLVTTGIDAPKLVSPFFDLRPTPPGLALTVNLPFAASLDVPFQLSPTWAFHLTSSVNVVGGTVVTVMPLASLSAQAGVALEGQILAQIVGAPAAPDDAIVLIGDATGSRLQIAGANARLGLSFAWSSAMNCATVEPVVQLEISGGKLIIDTSNGDGFLSEVTSGLKVEGGFDLGATWSASHGIQLQGSAGIIIELPVHLSLGPIDLPKICLGAHLRDGGIALEFSASIVAGLGPLVATVERLGIEATLSFPPNSSGNLGPVAFDIGFKPPSGVGLSLDTGVVKGGGYLFFDFDKEEYAGALELAFAEIVTVKAIGLITTRMPDGSKGFSLLIIISAEFTPIQLGFGFTLNGVGGLLGVNRTVVLDALRDGVRTGAINSIMFPKNVVANAPKIISDLRTIFPPYEGKFLIGPMVQIGWGTPTLISLSLGLIIEIPGNIAILGVLKIAIPTEAAPLILIQVNFVGTLDFGKKMLTFDASLFESRILFLTLEGDMAVRLRWGDDAAFLLSVGGFHPSFEPPPLALPALRRISTKILDMSWARIRVDSYYAITSNTVQFGSRAELFFGFDGLKLSGHIGYDVLFQFSPFYFIAQVSGSLNLEVIGVDLLSIRLKFSLEGPAPWRAKGSGSVTILFWDINADFDVTWGDPKNTSLPPVAIMPLLAEELAKKDCWKALPPPSNNLLVTLRKLDPALLVVHPVGALTVTQRSMPLGLTLDKFGTQVPSDVNRIDITSVKSGSTTFTLSPVLESFAPAQFSKMSDAEKLSRPSYQKIQGGVTISMSGHSLQTSKVARRTIDYEVTVIDKEPVKPLAFGLRQGAFSGMFQGLLRGSAVAKSKLSHKYKTQLQPSSAKIAVKPEGYTVASIQDNAAISAAATFDSEAMAVEHMKQQIAANPTLEASMHVIPNYEVNSP